MYSSDDYEQLVDGNNPKIDVVDSEPTNNDSNPVSNRKRKRVENRLIGMRDGVPIYSRKKQAQ